MRVSPAGAEIGEATDRVAALLQLENMVDPTARRLCSCRPAALRVIRPCRHVPPNPTRERRMNSGSHRGFTVVTIMTLVFAPVFSHHNWLYKLVSKTSETNRVACVAHESCPHKTEIMNVVTLEAPEDPPPSGGDDDKGDKTKKTPPPKR
jgi:hypothetical protein